jgi:hypothetical protein
VRADLKGTEGIYLYAPDPFAKPFLRLALWNDFFGLSLSMLKLVELYALHALGANLLVWISGSLWIISNISALVLIALGVSHEQLRTSQGGTETDLIVGELPTPTSIGGERRILIGIPRNTRHHVAWIIVWVTVALASAASLVLYYVVLGAMEAKVFYAWTGFQLVWLIARMAFFHFSGKHIEHNIPYVLVKKTWKSLDASHRARIRGLAYALSKYLTFIHPRKPHAYEQDATETPELGTIMENYPLAWEPEKGDIKINLTSVVGDTLLASVCWAGGEAPHLTGSTLYDSCIVQCRVGPKMVSIPAARVLTNVRPYVPPDEEMAPEVLFPPRGGSNTGPENLTWFFWIPCGTGLWLQVKSEKLGFLGDRPATLLTDEDLTATLQGGELFVSLRVVEEVQEIVETSRQACSALVDFIA